MDVSLQSQFPFEIDLEVRGYEIDVWNHVNNAVYLQWLEHARWEMSRKLGFGMLRDGVLPVVRHYELDYRAPCFLGDKVRVSLWPEKLGTTSFNLRGRVTIVECAEPMRKAQIALDSTLVLVCTEHGKKTAVPETWRQIFSSKTPAE